MELEKNTIVVFNTFTDHQSGYHLPYVYILKHLLLKEIRYNNFNNLLI